MIFLHGLARTTAWYRCTSSLVIVNPSRCYTAVSDWDFIEDFPSSNVKTSSYVANSWYVVSVVGSSHVDYIRSANTSHVSVDLCFSADDACYVSLDFPSNVGSVGCFNIWTVVVCVTAVFREGFLPCPWIVTSNCCPSRRRVRVTS